MNGKFNEIKANIELIGKRDGKEESSSVPFSFLFFSYQTRKRSIILRSNLPKIQK